MIVFSTVKNINIVKPLLVLLLVSLFSQELLAQQPRLDEVSNRELKVSARNAIRLGDTYTAILYFEEWNSREPKNIRIEYQLAELYFVSKDYKRAEKAFQEIIKKAEKDYPKSYFFLGETQMVLGKYKEAKQNFLAFEAYSRSSDNRTLRKMTDRGIESCDYALANKENEKFAVVKHLNGDLNKPHIEFSPVVYDENTLIYGSLRKDNLEYYDRLPLDSQNLPQRKLFVAIKERGQWVPKGELNGPFNNQDMDVGNAVMRQDGSRIYFTLCKKNANQKVICHLYYADKYNEGWSSAKKLDGEVNLPNFTSTQPAIGRESKKNQEIIYFISDRPGGKGGMDIWYTEYRWSRRTFKTPRNAGSKVNSIRNEATPYYDLETHRLYFSSDGRIGFGGYDIYRAEGEKSKWTEAEHLGNDLNSSSDDLDFTMHPNRKGGFLVSNRPGGASLSSYCCDDIYEFSFTRLLDVKLKGMARTKEGCLDSAWINLYIKNDEDEKYLSRKLLLQDCNFEINLEPGLAYVVELEKEGFFKKSTEISTKEVSGDEDFEVLFETEEINEESIVMEGIEYNYNSAELTDEAKKTLSKSLYQILKDNPSLKVEVSSHTDSKGTAVYNQSLSEKRARNVVNFLTQKGIDPKRLKAIGYGESKPVAPNENEDGSDNPEGRALNRRTEFKVIGKIPQVQEED